jgi:hypothetical protein
MYFIYLYIIPSAPRGHVRLDRFYGNPSLGKYAHTDRDILPVFRVSETYIESPFSKASDSFSTQEEILPGLRFSKYM